MGVNSVENDRYKGRIDYLRNTSAKIKFISFEPLLGAINNINLDGIHWVIAGGESGLKAREIKEDWVVQFSANVKMPVWHFSLSNGEVKIRRRQEDC